MTVPEDEPLGDVATSLLFENELVRVWQMRLKPGEASAMHRHDLPYLMCVVAGTSIDADWPGQPPMTIAVAPGDVLFVPPGATERAVNRSATEFVETLIEFKQPVADPASLGLLRHSTAL